jgi:DNA end-binding protein Ku
MVSTLIKEKIKSWSPSMVHDPVQARLRDIIASKKAAKQPARAKAEPQVAPSNVISIVGALRKSISSEKKSRSR